MNISNQTRTRPRSRRKIPAGEQGLVLFFALIALVAMSLAAVALVRSVDTATLISGNLAFRQSATTSGDSGLESALAVLAATSAANLDKDPFLDAAHPFNVSSPATGYHSSIDPALNLTSSATWTDANSKLVGTDASGNTIRYIIQRMCRTANQLLSTGNCLFGGEPADSGEKDVFTAAEMCNTPGCASGGKLPLYRITTRITGPKNTISYVQAFAY